MKFKQSLKCWAWFILILNASYAQGQNTLVDPQSSGQTRTLYTNLKNLSTSKINGNYSGKRILFGHQNTTLEGRTFGEDLVGLDQKSDVKSSVGSFPAIFGYDFNRGAFDPWQGVASYSQYENHLNQAFSHNALVVFSWHAKNPATGGNVYDTSGTPVKDILQGKSARTVYFRWLDDIAEFVKQIDKPIIFRPLMEDNGGFFWWGTKSGKHSPEEYKQLWQQTVNYLISKGVHNILYAYTPAYRQPDFYGSNYPGDAYVDIIGGDIYGIGDFSANILDGTRKIVEFAQARGKVAALTEVGPQDGFSDYRARADFYDRILLNTIKNDAIARKIAFIHVWRNGGPNHYWVPLQGDAAVPGFVNFYNNPVTVFTNQLFNLYQANATAVNGFPYCISGQTQDPDGDGWAWEFNKYSCVMPKGAADPSTGIARGSYRYCTANRPLLDPDGDGWAWQDSASCVIPGSPADLNANW